MAPDEGQLGFSFIAQPPARKVWTPRDLVAALRTAIEQSFGDVWLQGEISNFRPADSGHLYFTIKDDAAQLRVVMFRMKAQLLRFRPENGMQVVARGRPVRLEGQVRQPREQQCTGPVQIGLYHG